jgi:phenylpropionate dioxygenase-like ring-hydroxylating dioxygenase large terminal subunit
MTRDGWHAAARSEELRDRPLACSLQETPVVLYRCADGQAAALIDRCPHGLGPLSTGYVAGDLLICAYHGLRMDRRGVCVDSRLSDEAREASRVQTFLVEERDGVVWIRSAESIPSP